MHFVGYEGKSVCVCFLFESAEASHEMTSGWDDESDVIELAHQLADVRVGHSDHGGNLLYLFFHAVALSFGM